MKLRKLVFLIVLAVLPAGLMTCNVDHGLAPLPGRLELTVIFRNEPPSDTQGIYLTVMPDFPPRAINEVFHSPNSLPIDQDTVRTEIVLPYGDYSAIALWWYSTQVESNLADILAIPIDFTGGLKPLGFTLSEDNPIESMIVRANWEKVNRDAAIEGTIYFDEPFPENTDITAVAAFKTEPQSDIDYLIQLKSIDLSVPQDVKSYKYRLPVKNGSVGYVGVFWLGQRGDLNDFMSVGEYRDPRDSTKIGILRPDAGETITGVDIHVDWSRIPDELLEP